MPGGPKDKEMSILEKEANEEAAQDYLRIEEEPEEFFDWF